MRGFLATMSIGLLAFTVIGSGSSFATTGQETAVVTAADELAVTAPFVAETPDSADTKDLLPAKLRVEVNIARQEMKVYLHNELLHTWPVSTGRGGYATPAGTWRPYRMHKLWRSRKYNGAKMPHAVFYDGGFAIHGTNAISRLGRPASHGCVRLHPKNAKAFYNLVLKHKRAFTEVNLVGAWSGTSKKALKKKRRKKKSRRSSSRLVENTRTNSLVISSSSRRRLVDNDRR